ALTVAFAGRVGDAASGVGTEIGRALQLGGGGFGLDQVAAFHAGDGAFQETSLASGTLRGSRGSGRLRGGSEARRRNMRRRGGGGTGGHGRTASSRCRGPHGSRRPAADREGVLAVGTAELLAGRIVGQLHGFVAVRAPNHERHGVCPVMLL